MPVTIKLDEMLVKRKKRSRELADYVGISEQNISLFKTGRVKGLRFSMLEKMCELLECEPRDLLGFEPQNGEGKND